MILDGKALAESIRLRHAPEVLALQRAGRGPRLAAIVVGSDEAALSYVRGQRRGADAWGIGYDVRQLPRDASDSAVRAEIATANADPAVSGVLLQMPLPPHLSARSLQHDILPSKDVEGVHPENLGGVVNGKYGFAPCTALAVMALLEASGAAMEGAEAVVVGASEIVGKPVALLLLAKNATVTVTHIFTKDLASHTRRADLLVVAAGKAHLVKADMVKPGAVVVDVGINAVPAGGTKGGSRIVGDVDTEALLAKGCHVSPVPGGVGPVTVAMLLRNTVLAAGKSPAGLEPEATPLLPQFE